jgi:hypothetical protein
VARARKKYLVTRVQTTVVEAPSEEAAIQYGELALDFNGPDTEDTQVEEMDDAED